MSYHDIMERALRYATTNPPRWMFQRDWGDEVLEGLLSKEYVQINPNDTIDMTLKGTRALLDYEGLKYD